MESLGLPARGLAMGACPCLHVARLRQDLPELKG